MKTLYFLSIVATAFFVTNIQGQHTTTNFGRNEVLEDLNYLYHSLLDAHYDVYANVGEKDFKENYGSVRRSISKEPISVLEATTFFQKVISAVNNGHTEIDFPVGSYRTYAYAGGTLFPLELAFEGDKALVRKNWSANDSIPLGAELLGIDGKPISTILSKIYPQLSAERLYFKNAKIELYSFPRLFWQVYGKQNTFEVSIKADGKVKKYAIDAVNVIEGYEMKRKEVLNAQMQLKFHEKSAYLNPGNFSGEEENYQKFIDSVFLKIKKKNSENLIIDLRNNAGGDNSFSDYLVSYIADRPFKWNSRFTLKTSHFLKDHTRKNYDTTATFFREILTHNDGEIYDFKFDEFEPQPVEKRFNKNVYVLVNRQSHSQAAVTAAQIQDYNFGVIVGEETGDYPSLYASQFQFTLPNTEISVKVAKGYIVRVNGSTKEEGVIPDIIIKDHLLDEKDEIFEGLLKRVD